MSIAVWVDWRSKDKLPQHQREILLMRAAACKVVVVCFRRPEFLFGTNHHLLLL